MRILSDDGQEFKSVQECNAYESDLKLKKLKEEQERKEKEVKKKEAFNQIQSKANELNSLVEEYISGYKEVLNYEIDSKNRIIPKRYGMFANFPKNEFHLVGDNAVLDFINEVFDNYYAYGINRN